MFWESGSMSPSERALWSGLLLVAADNGFQEFGARKAKNAEKDGKSWSLVLAGELPDKVRGDRQKDAVCLVIVPAKGGKVSYNWISKDFSTFRKEIRTFLKSVDAWDGEKARHAWAIAIGVAVVVASVVLVATGVGAPAAAAVVAGGTALITTIEGGGNGDDIMQAVNDGLTDAAAAVAESDPEAAAVLAQAAQSLADVQAAVEGEVVEAEIVEAEDAPPSFVEKITALVEAHPVEAGLVGLGLFMLAVVAGARR